MKKRFWFLGGVAIVGILASMIFDSPPTYDTSADDKVAPRPDSAADMGAWGGKGGQAPRVATRSKEQTDLILAAKYPGAGRQYRDRLVWERHAMKLVDAIPAMIRAENITMEQWLAIPVDRRYEILERHVK